MPKQTEYVRRSVHPSPILNLIKRVGEWIFGWLETPLRRWQQHRIAREPATHEKGGRVVATDRELEFHPRSFEAIALARYNTALDAIGLGVHREQDSGLTR
jgi:hypothetical protein